MFTSVPPHSFSDRIFDSFDILEDALTRCRDEDMRVLPVLDACAFLESRLGKPAAIERLRRAFDLPDPAQRYRAADDALRLAKKQFWGTRA